MNTIPHTSLRPWQVVLLDRDPEDAKLGLATVAGPADVEPAGAEASLPEVATWVAGRVGEPVTLTRLPSVTVWRVDRDDR